MNEIIKILMERDGVSREEAKEMYLECKSELMDAISGTSCLDPEEVLASELGLEPERIRAVKENNNVFVVWIAHHRW